MILSQYHIFELDTINIYSVYVCLFYSTVVCVVPGGVCPAAACASPRRLCSTAACAVPEDGLQ